MSQAADRSQQRRHFFCALESRANGEAIFGTVARIRSWLLLEYPGAWRRHAVEENRDIPQEVKELLQTWQKSGRLDRCLLVRRRHDQTLPLRCFLVQSLLQKSYLLSAQLGAYSEISAIWSRAQPALGPLYAVCTHGRHDKCCAKFGLPVFEEFQRLRPELSWQCSHVGGDRFAANVVVLPYGIYYGRVTPSDVAAIVARTEQGQVWLRGYRGRSCFGRLIQVAEFFARQESGRLALDEFAPLERRELSAGRHQVSLFAPRDKTLHIVEFQVVPDRIVQRLTCHAAEAVQVPQYELLNYQVRSAES